MMNLYRGLQIIIFLVHNIYSKNLTENKYGMVGGLNKIPGGYRLRPLLFYAYDDIRLFKLQL